MVDFDNYRKLEEKLRGVGGVYLGVGVGITFYQVHVFQADTPFVEYHVDERDGVPNDPEFSLAPDYSTCSRPESAGTYVFAWKESKLAPESRLIKGEGKKFRVVMGKPLGVGNAGSISTRTRSSSKQGTQKGQTEQDVALSGVGPSTSSRPAFSLDDTQHSLFPSVTDQSTSPSRQ